MVSPSIATYLVASLAIGAGVARGELARRAAISVAINQYSQALGSCNNAADCVSNARSNLLNGIQTFLPVNCPGSTSSSSSPTSTTATPTATSAPSPVRTPITSLPDGVDKLAVTQFTTAWCVNVNGAGSVAALFANTNSCSCYVPGQSEKYAPISSITMCSSNACSNTDRTSGGATTTTPACDPGCVGANCGAVNSYDFYSQAVCPSDQSLYSLPYHCGCYNAEMISQYSDPGSYIPCAIVANGIATCASEYHISGSDYRTVVGSGVCSFKCSSGYRVSTDGKSCVSTATITLTSSIKSTSSSFTTSLKSSTTVSPPSVRSSSTSSSSSRSILSSSSSKTTTTTPIPYTTAATINPTTTLKTSSSSSSSRSSSTSSPGTSPSSSLRSSSSSSTSASTRGSSSSSSSSSSSQIRTSSSTTSAKSTVQSSSTTSKISTSSPTTTRAISSSSSTVKVSSSSSTTVKSSFATTGSPSTTGTSSRSSSTSSSKSSPGVSPSSSTTRASSSIPTSSSTTRSSISLSSSTSLRSSSSTNTVGSPSPTSSSKSSSTTTKTSSSTTTTASPAASATRVIYDLHGKWNDEGCYSESVTSDSAYSFIWSQALASDFTPQNCFDKCSGTGPAYTCAIGHNTCYALTLNNLPDPSYKAAGACTTACSNTAGRPFTCGGLNSLEMFIWTPSATGGPVVDSTKTWADQGCYADDWISSATVFSRAIDYTFTVDNCFQKCSSLSNVMTCAIGNGQCYALTLPTSSGIGHESSSCSTHCAGSPTLTCGGQGAIEIYRYSSPNNAIDASGKWADRGCFDEAWAATYQDTAAGYLPFLVEIGSNLSVQGCFDMCTQAPGIDTCALGDGNRCYGIKPYPTAAVGYQVTTRARACNTKRVGLPASVCGGTNLTELYSWIG